MEPQNCAVWEYTKYGKLDDVYKYTLIFEFHARGAANVMAHNGLIWEPTQGI